MIHVFVNGFNGRMGTEVVKAVLAQPDMELVGGYDPGAGTSGVLVGGQQVAVSYPTLQVALEVAKPDVLVDFTNPASVADNIRCALAAGVDCVIGTTGLTPDKLAELYQGAPAGSTLFVAPNFTIGAVLMMEFARKAAALFDDVEVLEFHHNGKQDAPSGTALNTALSIASARAQAKVSSKAPGSETELAGRAGARGTSVEGVPVHSIRSNGFVAHQEVIFGSSGETLTIRHDSIDRSSYMPGVLLAIRSVGERSGLIIGLEKLLDL
ncbi:MAG: 4-hydroxy-tetrahydrodipicolinate reductase [Coriobacteriales bacterium]|jgi:4-hydroxy-tetrahydrodipicolinate reductase|nr:4-hydroxy-tetrahydrodipicolinate reductase [Coriobacteriales bacterium]